MRTHRGESAKRGDVIESRSAVSGGLYGHIVVTDARASETTPMCGEGGWKCRKATSQEVKSARENGTIRTSYS